MADTILASTSKKQVWTTKYLLEYVRDTRFASYMGAGPDNVIQLYNELNRENGAILNIPFFTRLKGSGVTGSTQLEGNEEELGNYNAAIAVDWLRNAVKVPKSTQYATDIDILDVAKPALRRWSSEKLRDGIIAALGAIVVPAATAGAIDVPVAYGTATAGQRNTYMVSNSDRIIFGADIANASSGIWATALGNIDSTNDKLTTALISKAKRIAMNADPHIDPYKLGDGREYFIMFVNSLQMRDLQADTAMQAANRDARQRDVETNPIFQGGDLIWDGVIIREVPEMSSLIVTGAGNGGINVGPAFLCGKQGVAVAWGQPPRVGTDMLQDYKFRPAAYVEELRGIQKLSYQGKNYGVVVVWTASTPDV